MDLIALHPTPNNDDGRHHFLHYRHHHQGKAKPGRKVMEELGKNDDDDDDHHHDDITWDWMRQSNVFYSMEHANLMYVLEGIKIEFCYILYLFKVFIYTLLFLL